MNGVRKIPLPPLAVVLSISFVAPAIGTDQPKFEVASVKRTDQCSLENSVDPGMIKLNGDPLKVVLGEAFKMKMDQIVGPSWLDTDCFVIIAKMPEGATRDQFPPMLRTLLVERFKLVAHTEDRPHPGYALVVDKNGPKFKDSDPSSNFIRGRPGQVGFSATPRVSGIKGSMTMTALARLLSGKLDGPVQDVTGLQGTYDIDLSWVPDRSLEKMGRWAEHYEATHPSSTDPGAGPTTELGDLFTSIQTSLGLRLESRRGNVEVVVIDHIERVPTGN